MRSVSAALRLTALLLSVIAGALLPSQYAAAAPPVVAGMKSIGVALKAGHLFKGVEKTVFEHTLSTSATHGVMTEAWHAGKSSGINPNLRIRYYIDGEAVASVDYPLFLAHGTGPAQVAGTNAGSSSPPVWPKNETHIGPWGNGLFGRTHDSGWYNTYLVPFGKSIKITLTDPDASSAFWYMCRGAENLPIVAAGLTLPPSTRLHLQRTKETVQAGTLVKFATVEGKAGLMRQFNLVVNSTDYGYQEGCMSALIDGDTPLWMSSGLEDYFLGAYFHSMPTEHLPYSGFENIEPATSEEENPKFKGTNSLAAYRIHEPDPLLFTKDFTFQWIASSDNAHHNAGFCNYDWPPAALPGTNPVGNITGSVSVDGLAWVYVWDE